MIWGVAEVVMLALSGCKCRLSLAERFGCTETIINRLQTHTKTLSVSGKWQLSCIWWQAIKPYPLTPGLWKKWLPRDQSLVPKSLGTTGISHIKIAFPKTGNSKVLPISYNSIKLCNFIKAYPPRQYSELLYKFHTYWFPNVVFVLFPYWEVLTWQKFTRNSNHKNSRTTWRHSIAKTFHILKHPVKYNSSWE